MAQGSLLFSDIGDKKMKRGGDRDGNAADACKHASSA
jgi:hypothetical protein